MRFLFHIATWLLLATAPEVVAASPADANSPPLGRLPDDVEPTDYRIDLHVDPEQPRFSGHVEIDVTLKAPVRRIYLHGRNLSMTRATLRMSSGREVPAQWSEVDKTGVAQLSFADDIPAGTATLSFDYSAAFGDFPAGLYRVKVNGDWYSWSQMEPIDARAAFPSFDEPRRKTPFTISITTRPGYRAISNAPEVSVTTTEAGERHLFAKTVPLPTYLIAVATGPFARNQSTIPPTPQRAAPLPLGIVATPEQSGKMQYIQQETPRIVSLLEAYFDRPMPFPKLDQIASPIMPGAMENAGAVVYGNESVLLDEGSTVARRKKFGEIVGHELSHQWFGNLVTPFWWDDLWLNESFANWLGYRIANEWRPEMGIGVGVVAEGFRAMDTDALTVGRAIRQPIATNADIDGAFDEITYGKGGHVVAMIAAYLGEEKFKAGVRLHMNRHAYGSATSEEFFASLADAAGEPRIVAALKSFVDQPGVPVIAMKRHGDQLVLTQSRYSFLGGRPGPEQWIVPVCIGSGSRQTCILLGGGSTSIASPGPMAFLPNAGGAGYYRFDLEPEDWRRLIAIGDTTSPGDTLTIVDSLWATFRAGYWAG